MGTWHKDADRAPTGCRRGGTTGSRAHLVSVARAAEVAVSPPDRLKGTTMATTQTARNRTTSRRAGAAARVLLIHGTADWKIPPRSSQELHAVALHHSHLILVERAGHDSVMAEVQSRLMADVLAWIGNSSLH